MRKRWQNTWGKDVTEKTDSMDRKMNVIVTAPHKNLDIVWRLWQTPVPDLIYLCLGSCIPFRSTFHWKHLYRCIWLHFFFTSHTCYWLAMPGLPLSDYFSFITRLYPSLSILFFCFLNLAWQIGVGKWMDQIFNAKIDLKKYYST